MARTADAPAPSPEPPEGTESLAVSNPIRDAEVPGPRTARDSAFIRRCSSIELYHREALAIMPLTSFLRVATFVLFTVRLRHRIHVSLALVTKRFGRALCAFSVAITIGASRSRSARASPHRRMPGRPRVSGKPAGAWEA